MEMDTADNDNDDADDEVGAGDDWDHFHDESERTFEHVGGNSNEAAINGSGFMARLVMIEMKQSYMVMFFENISDYLG